MTRIGNEIQGPSAYFESPPNVLRQYKKASLDTFQPTDSNTLSSAMVATAELSVITYTPSAHSMAHWAIYLRIVEGNEIQHLIYQANGDEGELELDIREADPKASSRFRGLINVSDIDDQDTIAQVKETLERQPMQNTIPSWNCQDWVMEALEALNDEMLLDEYQYQEAKDTLENLFHD
ncbi:hypothetical protein EWM64_g1693 [Hericium alpestre]|uniref:Uncharacterized protein n=1 Tax=Hericium alpestre TaxID=135208 RepID=A0A4Z0A7R7_9AGAM|nr:hypothetical protein EWM64_g1693 [Hericium alpestre]